jgi:hypothetical protein
MTIADGGAGSGLVDDLLGGGVSRPAVQTG